MHKLHPKQINKIFGQKLYTDEFGSGTSTSLVVTFQMTDSFTLYGIDNKASSGTTDTGVDLTYCKIERMINGAPVLTERGEEVYGTLTKVGPVWTLFYWYKAIDGEAITPFAFTSDETTLRIIYTYRAQLAKVKTDILFYDNQHNTRKKYVRVENVQTITVDYNKEYFGKLPMVQFIDDSGNGSVVPYTIDNIEDCQEISFDFGTNVSGYIIIC